MDSAFRISSHQNRLTNITDIFRDSLDTVPNKREIKVFLQPSASRPDGEDALILKINAFILCD